MTTEHESAIVRCECSSLDHIAEFSFWNEPNDKPWLYLAVHIHSWMGFFRRLWVAVKYTFGYKCRYGHWDEMIVDVEQAKKIVEVCNKYIEAQDKYDDKLKIAT